MNAPPFPLNPQTGEWSGDWVWNGARWVASPTDGLRVITRVFTASGPYMPSPGLVSCQVECLGAGGGGGGLLAGSGWNGGGGGGGSGGYSRSTLPAALVRGGVLVTVGAGGDGTEISGGGANVNYAANGGPTTFGALVVAQGGGGGNTLGPGMVGRPGKGAPVGVGDLVIPGNAGGYFNTPGVVAGGDSLMYGGQGASPPGIGGGVGVPVALVNNGAADGLNDPVGPGCGGMGGIAFDGSGNADGGPGGSGLCVVTEYVVGDRDQPLTEWRPPLDVNVTVRPPGPHPWPPGGPWPPHPPGPWLPAPQPRGEFEAPQFYDQSINPETGQPWEDAP